MFHNDRTVLAPDGTRVAYSVIGSGPALVLTNGVTTSTVFWKYLRPMWQSQYTLVSWDLPGHGDSGPAATESGASVEALPPIMARIMDAVGLERAVHVGWSVGCQVVLEMYRQYPERVSALVTLFGPAGRALESTQLFVPARMLEWAMSLPQADVIAPLIARFAGLPFAPGVLPLLRRARLIGLQTSDRDVYEIAQQISRTHPSTASALVRSCQRHSAYDLLPQLQVPLLIMAAARDPFMPARTVARPMHAAAPTSELVILEGATHAALLDFPDEVAKHVDDFLARRLPQASR